MKHLPGPVGLYDPANEHDACGVAFVVDIHGRASHELVEQGISALVHLDHRGASGAETSTGDGAGILLQVPDAFYRDELDFELPEPGAYATGIAFLPGDDAAARLSTKHTLALTNRGSATTADLLALAGRVRDGVRDAFGVDLHPEPVWVGCSI